MNMVFVTRLNALNGREYECESGDKCFKVESCRSRGESGVLLRDQRVNGWLRPKIPVPSDSWLAKTS